MTATTEPYLATAMTEADVLSALHSLMPMEGWVVLEQVTEPVSRRRIDALCVRHADDGGFHTLAVEIKVTRQDYFAELRNPAKTDPWRRAATWHTFLTPAKLLYADDERATWSRYAEVASVQWPGGGSFRELRWTNPPPPDVPGAPLPEFVAWQVMERLMYADARLKGRVALGGRLDTIEDARAAAAAAPDDARRTHAALERAIATGAAWKALAARQGEKVPCADCGAPVVPTRVHDGAFTVWRHAQPDLTTTCPATTGHRPIAPAEDL